MRTERLGPGDYPELMEFLDRAFGFAPEQGFFSFLPKLYRPEYDPCRCQLAVREEGRICGAAGLYPVTLRAGGQTLRCCCVGNVAVEQACRGQGVMSLLMTDAVRAAADAGCELAVLGGQRQRYARFGFEPAGTDYVFSVTRANIRHCFGGEASGLTLRQICPGDAGLLAAAGELYRRQPLYAERAPDRLYDILVSWGYRPMALLRGEDFAGYCLCKDREVRELLLGDPGDLGPACAALVGALGDIRLCLPCYAGPWLAAVYRFAETYRTEHWERFLVFRFRPVLSACLGLKAAGEALPEGGLTLRVQAPGGDETLRLSVRGDVPEVSDAGQGASPELTLSYPEAMELFFSAFSGRRRELPEAARAWFPLPLSLPMADHA